MRWEANSSLDMESLVPSGAATECQTGNVWSSWDPCHVPNSCEGKHCVLEAAGGVRREPLEFIKLPGSLGVECRGVQLHLPPNLQYLQIGQIVGKSWYASLSVPSKGCQGHDIIG